MSVLPDIRLLLGACVLRSACGFLKRRGPPRCRLPRLTTHCHPPPYFVETGKFLVLRNTPFNLRIFSFTFFTSSSGSGWLQPRLAYDRATDASRSCSRTASATAMASCVVSTCASSPSRRSERPRDRAASFSAWLEAAGGSFFVGIAGGGDVCVPTSREKSSVGSEHVEASSSGVVVGMEETVASSLERRAERWDEVVSESSWRAVVCVVREGST